MLFHWSISFVSPSKSFGGSAVFFGWTGTASSAYSTPIPRRNAIRSLSSAMMEVTLSAGPLFGCIFQSFNHSSATLWSLLRESSSPAFSSEWTRRDTISLSQFFAPSRLLLFFSNLYDSLSSPNFFTNAFRCSKYCTRLSFTAFWASATLTFTDWRLALYSFDFSRCERLSMFPATRPNLSSISSCIRFARHVVGMFRQSASPAKNTPTASKKLAGFCGC